MNRTPVLRAILLVGTALAACGSSAAWAQSQPDPAPAAAAPEPAQSGLEDIIVTGRKQAENLQNIPVAETVISAAQLQGLGVTSIEKMSSLAPQLIIGRSGAGNGASIGLRGVSVANSSVSIEQSVATVIDGVYYSGGRALNEGLFDLSQAEVLKGPQSLFYGKNTTAGVISLTTAMPTAEFTGMMKASYEVNAKQPTFEGFLSGPMTDTLSFRLAGRWSKQYGALFTNINSPHTDFTYDSATGKVNPHLVPAANSDMPGEQTGIIRGTLRWEPTSNFSATAKLTYNSYSSNSPNNNVVISYCPPTGVPSDPSAPCGHNFVLTQNAVPADIAGTNRLMNVHGGQPFADYESFSALGNIQYSADHFTLSVTPGFITWKNAFLADFDHVNNYPLVANALGAKQGSWTAEKTLDTAYSVEARLQSKLPGMFNFMVGGYYQNNKLDFAQDTNAPTGFENSAAVDPTTRFVSVRKISHTYGETMSGFAQVMVDITGSLNVTGGARYTHETKSSVFNQPYVTPGAQATYLISTIGADQTFNNWSPEATITWKPIQGVTTYVSYRTGYKSGGYSISGLITRNTKVTDPQFAPEETSGFEGGVKTTLFDNQLRVNLDLFTYEYKNLQVDFLDSTLIQFFTLNAAALRTKGGELQLEFAPHGVPGLRMRGTIGYISAKYTSFPFAPCLSGQTVAQGCVFGATPTGNRFSQDLTGQKPQQAPEWTGSLGIDYNWDLSPGYKLLFSGNGRYSSSYSTNPFSGSALAYQFDQRPFATVDASVRLTGSDDRWELAVIGKNLSNAFIATTASNVPFTVGSVRSGVLDPRTVTLEAVFKF
ncbi:TonB-dependent receptor [Sphingomonas immobilis]|uniref:TonB-dependent receptor n=1 Tax=Sphingomonas immobilis TaxID=3063997 RepID=A0ABT9A1Q4_9SPHN|nr:TonB-dependent receptor [Sphingomonas sp. CA1-15]MDO7843185.1 TonB-dependent receptor [Sphingomonas sp. CA1-15]